MSTPASRIACLEPADEPGGSLRDITGRLTLERPEPHIIRLRGELRPGLYDMRMETQAGTFPIETTMIRCLEWPSRREVMAGPFDLDHTRYDMAVPTFRLFLNGEDQGLVWCEVPSPGDVEQRRIRARWGVRIGEGGSVEIQLEIPEGDRARLRWDDLSRLELRPDDRFSLTTWPRWKEPPAHPRLLVRRGQLDRLARERDEVQQALLENYQQVLAGEHTAIMPRTAMAALVGRMTGDEQLKRLAIDETLTLCRCPYWGYHDEADIMGWNNDRDTGIRMSETAAVYDWLFDELNEQERTLIREKLAYHAEIAFRVTTLQKNYWYYRCCEAHGEGLWFGLAAAATVLLGEDERAPEWLDWAHGNLVDALSHMPDDGISEWHIFNVQWHIAGAMLFESLMGRRLKGDLPFLAQFRRNIVSVTQGRGGGLLAALLFYLAGRHEDAVSQADALRAGRAALSSRHTRGFSLLHALALLAYDPALSPAEPSPLPRAFCSRSGDAFCWSTDGDVTFNFRCGTPQTRRHHEAHHWMNRAWYQPQHAGSFSWRVGRQVLVPINMRGYRHRTSECNVVTVDGVGSPVDGRWLGYAIPLEKTPVIERFDTNGTVTACRADLARAYTDACGVVQCIRRWLFLHEPALLVMEDVIETDRPRDLVWHLHANRGGWEEHAPFTWQTRMGESALGVRVLDAGCNCESVELADQLTARVEAPQWVPPYTSGINTYKTRDWQPEIVPTEIDIPEYLDLQLAPSTACRKWRLLTVMGPDTGLVGAAEVEDAERLAVRFGAGTAVHWPENGDA